MSVCTLGAGDNLGSASQEHPGQARALQDPQWEPLFSQLAALYSSRGATHLTLSSSIYLSMDIEVVRLSWLLCVVLQKKVGCVYLFGLWFSLDICLAVGFLDQMCQSIFK